MSNELRKYLKELENELLHIQKKNEVQSDQQKEHKLKLKIKKVKSMIEKNRRTFLIKTSNGYLSSNGKYTDNVNLAYTFEEEEAVQIARETGGWLEEMP